MNIITKNILILSVVPILGTIALIQPSCQYYDAAKAAISHKTTPQTADQIIIDAEKTTKIADDTFNTFLKLDYDNKEFFKAHAPSVDAFASYLKENDRALNWLKQARSATKAFKANRTVDNQANLQTLIATIKQAIADTQTNMATANALNSHNP